MNLFETNWEEQLQNGDTSTLREGDRSIDVVLLSGLQRLARKAGICSQSLQILTPSSSMVQAIFTATFRLSTGEECQFVGAADCTSKNTSGKYVNYPTAVAESRAEARCLRKALGIRMLSSEEIGFQEGATALEASPSSKASSSIVAAIENLCDSKGIAPVRVLEAVLSPQRASTIFELSELTTVEAQKAMAWLNEQPESKRAARKAELKAKQEN